MGRPLNSADYLIQDCIEDRIPDDPEVEEHFGFHRFPSFSDRSKLLGLYKGLFYLNISSDELDSWRLEGTLVDNITKTFSTLPESNRGGYFPWFLGHKHVLDGSKTSDEAFDDMTNTYNDEARLQLEPEDQEKEVKDLEPPAKRKAFFFFAMALHGWHPRPSDTGPYYDFGFCTCLDEYTEARLGGLYQELLVGDKFSSFGTRGLNLRSENRRSCTFAEFWRALESGKLIDLMDSKGFKPERQTFRHLDTFLEYPPNEPHCSVWKLQVFLSNRDTSEAPSPVLVDYGFMHCKGYFEVMELKSVYRSVLQLSGPLALHDACVKGRLFEFARSFVKVEPRLSNMMRNPYPLQAF